MTRKSYDKKQVHELLLQSLETERGGIKIYENAIASAQNKDLRKEWQSYLEETRTHEQVLLRVFTELGIDPEEESGGCWRAERNPCMPRRGPSPCTREPGSR